MFVFYELFIIFVPEAVVKELQYHCVLVSE